MKDARYPLKGSAKPAGNGGSALILVLWVIGVLAMFIGNMAFDAHIEARITSYYRKRHKAVHLAHSGVELAKLIMAKSSEIDPSSEAEPPDDDSWYLDAERLAKGNSLNVTYTLGEGEIVLSIVTEQARRNVNLLTLEEEWEPVLAVGGIPEELWPELIEPFLDWTDKDDSERVDGAETEDYYATLEQPYRARNGQPSPPGCRTQISTIQRRRFHGVIRNLAGRTARHNCRLWLVLGHHNPRQQGSNRNGNG